jgi:hypothetical protein
MQSLRVLPFWHLCRIHSVHAWLLSNVGVGLVKCAANAVVGGGVWVGSTLFRLLLRRQSNGTEAVKEIYLSPIQVSSSK